MKWVCLGDPKNGLGVQLSFILASDNSESISPLWRSLSNAIKLLFNFKRKHPGKHEIVGQVPVPCSSAEVCAHTVTEMETS